MKYFTAELWLGIQSQSTHDESSKQWDKNVVAYYKQLEDLCHRLSKRNAAFFKNHSLHDGRLLRFTIVDETSLLIKKSGSYHKTKYFDKPLTIKLEVLSDEYVYELTFRKVRNFHIDYCGGDHLLPPFANDFGDWGYAELTDGGEDFFLYEILFSSGSTIRLLFKSFSYSRKKFMNGSLEGTHGG